MKRLISIALSLTIVFSAFAINVTTTNAEESTSITQTFLDRVKQDYDLVWSDEFNGDSLNLDNWVYDVGTYRNSELQCYTGIEGDNLQFDGENAVFVPQIEKAVDPYGREFNYTSAEISTSKSRAWKYGYFEFRAKLSCGQNVVPAIWTMGYTYDGSGGWPNTGEIDILESFFDNSVSSTLHYSDYGYNNHIPLGIGGQDFNHKVNEEFHNYWLYWTDKYLITGVDDEMYQIVDITTPALSQSFRNYEQWILINVALGMFANPVDDSQEDEWKMWVDYARVYQLEEDKLYDNYIAISALDLLNDGNEDGYYKQVYTLNSQTDQINFTVNDELEPGKYDVYAELINNSSGTQAYINGVKTNKINYVNHGVGVGNQGYVGSVDLQDDSSFVITLKGTTSARPQVEKLFFIKTDNNKTTPVVVNKDNGVTVSDYFEVENEAQLYDASRHILPGGTIKLTKDISITRTITVFDKCDIDLNGNTLTAAGGRLAAKGDSTPLTVKNGKIKFGNGTDHLFLNHENNYSAKINLVDVDVTVDTAKQGQVFDQIYGALSANCSNCTFTYTDNTSTTNAFYISKCAATYNNCTFNLNGRKPFFINNGTKVYLNSCTFNDAATLFYSDSALNSGEIKLANVKLNNLTALTNHADSVSVVKTATNNILKNENGEEISFASDMSGNFEVSCNHSYVDGNCETPKHCEYCNLSDGTAPGHSPTTVTTPSDCVYKGSIKSVCETCNKTLSEKTLPVAEHNFVKIDTIEPTCRKAGYHLWECSECGTQQQRSYNGDNVIYKLPHNYDESKTTVVDSTCTMLGYTLKHCLVCDRDYKIDYKLKAEHDYTVTVNKAEGIILYDCKNCDASYTVETEKCEHEPDGDGVVTNPTLKDEGYTTYTCALCSEEYQTDFVPALKGNLSLGLNTLAGASIRLNDKTGLRFYTEVNQDEVAYLRTLGFTVELGTLIAPYDLLDNKELNFDLSQSQFVDVKYDSSTYYSDVSGFSGVVGSIVNIKESTVLNPTNGNVLRYFVGRGYAKITDENGDTEIVYADYSKTAPRSLGLVAFRFKADVDSSNNEIYNAYAEKIDKWSLAYEEARDNFEVDKW